ncbi:MAG: carbonic anhydrase [bacterium]|nr:carbonic anhydrase [bacterium]
MEIISKIFLENKAWAADKSNMDKEYFYKLSLIQEPDFLWIGCSDSRVPANEITNTEPGEMFVHRNIANVVDLNDINLMSVMQYAVEYLKIKHIIVCGHYGCGGIKAAMSKDSFGKMDIWLSKIKEVYSQNVSSFDGLETEEARLKKMVELNVIAGVKKIQSSELIQSNPEIVVHGWVYDLLDGILHRIAGGTT